MFDPAPNLTEKSPKPWLTRVHTCEVVSPQVQETQLLRVADELWNRPGHAVAGKVDHLAWEMMMLEKDPWGPAMAQM
jgi:hypothetical protein